jgi:hypothetical protein
MRGAGIADELLTASIQYIINVAMVSAHPQIAKRTETNTFNIDPARNSLSR